MAHIGPLSLEEWPRIVIAIRDQVDRRSVQAALDQGAEILEFRIDHFNETSPAYVREELQRFQKTPRLATIRSAKEGGAWKGSEAQRLALFQHLLPDTEAIDIEISSTEIVREVIAACKEAGKSSIASFHDFETTPNEDRLEALLDKAKELQADMLKIAVQCNSRKELHRLARFSLAHTDFPLVIIGMGAMAKLSRVFFPALGSLLSYTFLGEPTAPGQLTCEELLRYRKVFYGE